MSSWERLVHPEDLPGTLLAVKDFIEGRAAKYEVEFRMRRKDGGWQHVLSRATRVCDDQGQPVRLVGTHVDITERKQAEQEIQEINASLEQRVQERTTELSAANTTLREREAMLRLSLEASNAGVWSWDAQTHTAQWDKNYHELYGFSDHDPISQEAWLKRIHPRGSRPARKGDRVAAQARRIRRVGSGISRPPSHEGAALDGRVGADRAPHGRHRAAVHGNQPRHHVAQTCRGGIAGERAPVPRGV
ncbi:MAG: PAS domain-containing protein [Rhodobacteraceae bacterium]|nr:PAS domain-containing protein [Paracoccaceae bacterium]